MIAPVEQAPLVAISNKVPVKQGTSNESVPTKLLLGADDREVKKNASNLTRLKLEGADNEKEDGRTHLGSPQTQETIRWSWIGRQAGV